SSFTASSASPRQVTLPWPKMAKTPANSGTSWPSITVRCAVRYFTRAWAMVRRMVFMALYPPDLPSTRQRNTDTGTAPVGAAGGLVLDEATLWRLVQARLSAEGHGAEGRPERSALQMTGYLLGDPCGRPFRRRGNLDARKHDPTLVERG